MLDHAEALNLCDTDFYPKNIRQMGNVDQNSRIYIEDYVYTYIHQYASFHKKEEQIIFLIGAFKTCNEERILLINGAVKSKSYKNDSGLIDIPLETWEDVEEQRAHYFREQEIVGLVYTQPGYGILLTSNLINLYKEYFDKDGQVFLIVDPIEKEEMFFYYENEMLMEKEGFFIFYDRNDAMHEYMLDNKVVQNPPEPIAEEVLTQYRFIEQEKREAQSQKRVLNMSILLSGALLIMCIIIGAGLINNIEEVDNLKASVVAVINDNHEPNQPATDVVVSTTTPSGTDEDSVTGDDSTGLTSEEPVIAVNTPETPETVTSGVPATESTEKVIPNTYTVLPGDNLIRISLMFYGSRDMVDEIQDLNGISNADRILVGQDIMLP